LERVVDGSRRYNLPQSYSYPTAAAIESRVFSWSFSSCGYCYVNFLVKIVTSQYLKPYHRRSSVLGFDGVVNGHKMIDIDFPAGYKMKLEFSLTAATGVC
jgi:hypothetical protein